MGKKTEIQPEAKPLPFSNAESAEKRLEELVKNKSIKYFKVMQMNESYAVSPFEGECRVYPDGFESLAYDQHENGVITYKGHLYLDRRRAYASYYWEKDFEKQKLLDKEEK